MTGLHRTHNKLSLKIAGGLIAGSALAGVFGMSASADTPKSAQSVLNSNVAALPQMPVPASGSMTTDGKAADKAAEKAAEKAADKAADKTVGKGPAKAESTEKKKRPTAQQMIAEAKTQLGQRENANGETKFAEWYSNTDRALETIKRDGGARKAYRDANWCDMFVSWVADRVGAADTVGQDAWTVAHAEWFKDNDKWGTKPKTGAIVFFDWGGSKDISDIQHVGIVTGVKDGKINTIEGNTENKVELRTRSASQIVGYGYPEYAG